MAGCTLSQTKAEIIGRIRELNDPKGDDAILKALMDGREAAAELLHMIQQAELRFA
jgi:hypothetical protein